MGQFERIRYPDGQIGAKWIPGAGDELPFGSFDYLKIRINSYEDLFYVRSIGDIIKYHSINAWKLFIPCMFGQRSDRRFDKFQSFDLKLICDVINECEFDEVQIFDPHSDVTMALLNRSTKLSSFEYVENTVRDIITERQLLGDGYMTDLLLISPDAGAYKKVFEYGERMNLPVMAAVKHRDLDGKIDLKFTGDVNGKDCLIVDDLCDGGYTFIILTDALRKKGARRVYLYISHGLFSKGFAPLFAKIDHIYTTNSVKDLDMEATFEFQFEDGASAVFPVKDYVTQYKII